MADPVPILVSRTLKTAGFAHGFSTRIGGVSEPPYESLDFAILRDGKRLEENQRRLAAAVGFDPRRLFQTHQVHGSSLVVANGDPKVLLEQDADALVAEPKTGDAVAIRVADCVPVLIADRTTGRVAAVHAGWRGVASGIVGVAIAHMVRAEATRRPPAFIAAIGPCIGACCFEVGLDVAAQIARTTADEVIAASDDARGKAFVDLRRAVRIQLRAEGLADDVIDDVPDTTRGTADACTRCDAKRFYSYRRDGDASGRLAGVIASRP